MKKKKKKSALRKLSKSPQFWKALGAVATAIIAAIFGVDLIS